jgi:glycogen(starch) synthase
MLALRERGYEFAVVTSHSDLDLPDEGDYEGIPIYRFHFWRALADRKLDLLMQAKQQVAELKRYFKPDLIHVNLIDPSGFFHLQTANVYPAPTVVSLHVMLPKQTSGRDALLERALRSAQWVTANSEAVLAGARQLVPEITPYSSVIYNGLDMPTVTPALPPPEAPRLLCLGRLVGDKGFDLALTALASLVGRFPRLRLVVAGDGPARPELERQAADLGLGQVVEFIGRVEPVKVPSLMNAATIVVMPSRWEAFGLVALEAALMARPVVATRVGGLAEVVVHQHTGLVVGGEDSSGLAEAIAFLLDYPETAIEMGLAGRSRAQELFNLERYVNAYQALYLQMAGASPGSSLRQGGCSAPT